jgi:hypothetical protein
LSNICVGQNGTKSGTSICSHNVRSNTENAKTVDISLWLRHDHFVIPSVDLKPFFGKKLTISETGVISEFGKIIEWLTDFEVPDQKPTTCEELVKKYHLHPEEVVKQKYQSWSRRCQSGLRISKHWLS